MKTFYKVIALVLVFASCTKDLDLLNKNIKNLEDPPAEALFTSAQKALVDQMINTSVNRNVFRLFAQHWTETVYTDETNYNVVTRNIPEQHWNILYRDVLKDLNAAQLKLASATGINPEELAIIENKKAITEVLSVFAYSILVETFGNVPYTESLNIEIRTPKYDDGLTIYKDLLARLSKAIALMDTAYGSFGVNDNIYTGNVTNWYKFANSLKLKMGIMLSDITNEATLVKETVLEASTNVFDSQLDSARFTYLTSPPNTNPLYLDLEASGRNDFVPANTLVNMMIDLQDPRLPLYFEGNLIDPITEQVFYKGGTYGSSASYPNHTHITERIESPDFKGTLMDYAEVKFLLAEASARGLLPQAQAPAHYYQAIEASILDWGGSSDDVEKYLVNPAVVYDPANWKEKIGNQAWLGLFNRGYEAWTSYRRLDFPKLVAPNEAMVDIVPLRFTYPISEQTQNPTNFDATELLQPSEEDVLTDKLFWDIN